MKINENILFLWIGYYIGVGEDSSVVEHLKDQRS